MITANDDWTGGWENWGGSRPPTPSLRAADTTGQLYGYKAISFKGGVCAWEPTWDINDLTLPDHQFLPASSYDDLEEMLSDRMPAPDLLLTHVCRRICCDYRIRHLVTVPFLALRDVSDLMCSATPKECMKPIVALITAHGPIYARMPAEDLRNSPDYQDWPIVAATAAGKTGGWTELKRNDKALKRRQLVKRRERVAAAITIKRANNQALIRAHNLDVKHQLELLMIALERVAIDAFRARSISVHLPNNAGGLSNLHGIFDLLLGPGEYMRISAYQQLLKLWGKEVGVCSSLLSNNDVTIMKRDYLMFRRHRKHFAAKSPKGVKSLDPPIAVT